MANYNGLITKLKNKVGELDEIESLFSQLTISRIANLGKAERVAANIVTLMSKIEEISKKRDAAKDKDGEELNEAGKDILQSFLDFAFKEEKDLIYSIVADIFDISTDEVVLVPLSCIYECIIKDKVMRAFFPQLAISDARARSDTLPNPATYPSPPTPFTSKANTNTKPITRKPK